MRARDESGIGVYMTSFSWKFCAIRVKYLSLALYIKKYSLADYILWTRKHLVPLVFCRSARPIKHCAVRNSMGLTLLDISMGLTLQAWIYPHELIFDGSD